MSANVLVVHGGGPTAVINASLYGVVEEAKSSGSIGRVYGAIGGSEGILKENFLDLMQYPEEKLSLLLQTPATAIGSSRYALKQEDYNAMAGIFRKYGIRYVLLNGGNGTMDTCGRIFEACRGEDIYVVGIPKTIDNDIAITDHTPGYGSAARLIAASAAEVGADVKALPIHVCVMEAMGRNAGWITAASALARKKPGDAPHLIYLPERPFDEEAFLKRVAELEKERHNVIIAVSEGVKNKDGVFLCDLVSTAGQLDAFGHKAILSGTSRYLADLIRVRLGCKTRAIEFSTLQRCASHLASRTDITEAYQVGGAAVEAAVRGETAKMAAIKRKSDQPYRAETEMVDVTKVANFEKKVPLDWITEDGMHVNENFERYARPLIQAELTPIYINGVPRHIHL